MCIFTRVSEREMGVTFAGARVVTLQLVTLKIPVRLAQNGERPWQRTLLSHLDRVNDPNLRRDRRFHTLLHRSGLLGVHVLGSVCYRCRCCLATRGFK
jgi:hypothetical protein